VEEQPIPETVEEQPIPETVEEQPIPETVEEQPIPEPVVEDEVVKEVKEPIYLNPSFYENKKRIPSIKKMQIISNDGSFSNDDFKKYILDDWYDNQIERIDESEYPSIIFIVPYRDREKQYQFFSNHMKMVLSDCPKGTFKILYIHQKDNREFNRGAMKNIGFLLVKQMYPDNYKDITLIFNDIDVMPFTKNFLNYETEEGVVKHFYGFTYTLGGIVSIKCSDFEKINGFPNFWAWGYEDNLLQTRVESSKLLIDRSVFYPYLDKNILHLQDGLTRSVNRTEFDEYVKQTEEGINSISNLEYKINEETGFVDVSNFTTGRGENTETKTVYDLRNGNSPFYTPPLPSKKNQKKWQNAQIKMIF
jgi:hypothetical protein